MILRTKGIPPRRALITVGAEILRELRDEAKTVSRLWNDFQGARGSRDVTFDWFVLGLNLLYLMGAVDFDRGRVRRTEAGPAVSGDS